MRKKIARKDNLKKHMKFCCFCRQCSKNFENIKELKQHNCTNLSGKEAASTNKTVSSLEEGSRTTSCSSEASSKKKSLKIKRHSNIEAATYPAAKKSKHDIVEDEQMDETDDDIKEFTKKYWSSIRSFSRKNKVQNIFNFYYNKDLKEMVQNNVPSKSLLSVRGMKGRVSSGEYYLSQGSFGFLSQNKSVL